MKYFYLKKKKKKKLHFIKILLQSLVDKFLIWLNLREAMRASKVFTELSLHSMRGEVKKKRCHGVVPPVIQT